jgi:RND family efflux transporter, MFP subunit
MELMKKPTAIAIAIAILITSIIFIGVKFSQKSTEQPLLDSLKVEVDRIRTGSLTRNITVVGMLSANHSVTMKAQLRGLISKVQVQGGEEVEKGDILFEIDDRSFQASLKEAQALLTLAESEFARTQKLSDKNFGAQKTLEQARAQLLKAQAQVEKAQKELDDTKIVAPFEGVISLHKISEGTPITGDLDLVTITDVDPMKVEFDVAAKYIPYLNNGQKVRVAVDTYPNQQFEGKIDEIDVMVNPGTQTIKVRASIDNSKRLLKPGMFVRVALTVGSKDNSLIAPEEAIVTAGDQHYVWKVIEHPDYPGKFLVFRVPVQIGIQENDRVEIRRGLREDDIVITVGHNKVRDGYAVRFDLASVGLDEASRSNAPAPSSSVNDSQSDKAPQSKTPSKDEAASSQAGNAGADNQAAAKESNKAANQAPVPSLSDRIKGFFGSLKAKLSSKDKQKAPESNAKNPKEATSTAASNEEQPEPALVAATAEPSKPDTVAEDKAADPQPLAQPAAAGQDQDHQAPQASEPSPKEADGSAAKPKNHLEPAHKEQHKPEA